MSWKEILKSDDDHKKDKRFIQRKKETWKKTQFKKKSMEKSERVRRGREECCVGDRFPCLFYTNDTAPNKFKSKILWWSPRLRCRGRYEFS